MKKSVLAVAIAAAAFAASAASAATVYDKDGTSLQVGGQVEFMTGSAGNAYFHDEGDNNADVTTRDRARLTMAGRTQLTSGIAAYAYNEWQFDHTGDSAEAGQVKARQQYLGVDFGTFGKVQMGRYKDPAMEYTAAIVDILDEVGVFGGNNERNSGHLSYMWSGYGFDAGVSYQFAVDNYQADIVDNFDVDSGFSVYAGYTSPVVGFGPITVRVGYEYLNGQQLTETGVNYYESSGNLKTINAGLGWGTNGKGFYIGTHYSYSKATQYADVADIKVKASETVATYGFTNGIRLGASYHFINFKDEGVDVDAQYVQLIADYNVTSNFKVWVEGLIDCGSDDYAGFFTHKLEGADDKDAHNSIMFGARYVF